MVPVDLRDAEYANLEGAQADNCVADCRNLEEEQKLRAWSE
jgi:hypothetical protein